MASLKGQAEYAIDAKGRLAIPVRMRESMSPEERPGVVITRGMENCIFLYPLDRWSKIEEKVGELNPFKPDSRNFVRMMMRWAEEQQLDAQGRVVLPRSLVEFAGLKERATIVGAFDHIEIWDPAVFEAYLDSQTEDYETLAERVMTQ